MLIYTDDVIRCFKTHKEWFADGHFNRILDKSVEEMAELIQAIMKLKDSNSAHNLYRVREEFADVLLCLEFLGRDLGITQDKIDNDVSERAFKLDNILTELIKATKKNTDTLRNI